ncbi:uncharacterized protein LOC114260248 [Camellia sinensis]|uniref:uncharacterized protein LOC114260248 n=1 Tax=Camellia sinensis TaxID=4442 RepID=UPI001036DCB2|nr:uncharacterized protein LOC114260248 [Camellia sinensis]
MLRLIRILMHVQRYRAFVATFLTLIPSLMPYLGTIFCVMCIYCSLGLQIFGGTVNAGNPDLEGTDLAKNDYVLFNFNDYPNGMVTLFNLLVMGNWHIWMQVSLICHDHLYLLCIHAALCMTEEYINCHGFSFMIIFTWLASDKYAFHCLFVCPIHLLTTNDVGALFRVELTSNQVLQVSDQSAVKLGSVYVNPVNYAEHLLKTYLFQIISGYCLLRVIVCFQGHGIPYKPPGSYEILYEDHA